MVFHPLNSQKPSFIKALPIYFINLVLLLLSGQVVDVLAVDNVHVIVFLIAVFYWMVHMPSVMPLWFVFLGGLYIDFAVDSILGFHAFGLLVYVMVLNKVRRIILSQPVLYHFVIFALTTIIFELSRWLLLSLLSLNVLTISQNFQPT